MATARTQKLSDLATSDSPFAGLEMQSESIVRLISDSIKAIDEAAMQLNLTPEERQNGISRFAAEAVGRMPQIAKALFITALLPTLTARTLRHLQFAGGMEVEDAEDLSQEIAAKILSALWGRQPQKNVGAWLAQIRTFSNVDQSRKDSREKIAMERLKKAAKDYRR